MMLILSCSPGHSAWSGRPHVRWYLRPWKDLHCLQLILTIFLSSSFLDIEIFTHFLAKKMRITLFILNHRYVPFQLHHLSITAVHHFPDYPIPSLYASYQLKELRKYVLFQLRNAPVYGKQVLFHPDTDWLVSANVWLLPPGTAEAQIRNGRWDQSPDIEGRRTPGADTILHVAVPQWRRRPPGHYLIWLFSNQERQPCKGVPERITGIWKRMVIRATTACRISGDVPVGHTSAGTLSTPFPKGNRMITASLQCRESSTVTACLP